MLPENIILAAGIMFGPQLRKKFFMTFVSATAYLKFEFKLFKTIIIRGLY